MPRHAPRGAIKGKPDEGLTARQARFVAEYLVDLNGTQAAIRAGYSPETAESQASRLLTNAKVSAAVSAGKAAQLSAAQLTAARVLEELRRLAFSDVRGLFDEAGNLRPLHELTAEQAAAIASLEVVKKNVAAGDGQVDTIHKVKVWDKTKALESLAKHFGLLTERVEHGGSLVIRHEQL
jgi:phage terminase small subunit